MPGCRRNLRVSPPNRPGLPVTPCSESEKRGQWHHRVGDVPIARTKRGDNTAELDVDRPA